MIAGGWVLVVGIAALLLVLVMAVLAHRADRGPVRPRFEPATLGAGLVVMGIVFGEDPVVGYGLIAAGVIVSVAAVVARRSSARS
jgi:uncharacterized membrane protein